MEVLGESVSGVPLSHTNVPLVQKRTYYLNTAQQDKLLSGTLLMRKRNVFLGHPIYMTRCKFDRLKFVNRNYRPPKEEKLFFFHNYFSQELPKTFNLFQ